MLFIMLYKVVLSFESVAIILKCDHSNASYSAVRTCGALHYAVNMFKCTCVDRIFVDLLDEILLLFSSESRKKSFTIFLPLV